jgi:xylan 1,4-beta-xylosidase
MSSSCPAPAPEESFHSHHAPFGAFASFTVGLVDAPGGFGQSLRGPADQNVYVGFREGQQGGWHLLPFFKPPESYESAFTGEPAVAQGPTGFTSLRPAQYSRRMNWASDTWRADGDRFGFSLLTPFEEVPDPARMTRAQARRFLAPVICGWIEYDNRAGKAPVELMFGLGNPQGPLRPLDEDGTPLDGFACEGRFGYATASSAGAELRQGFDVFSPKYRDYRGLLVIGGESALVFHVPGGRRRRFPLVFGFYQGGGVTDGLPAAFAYTRVFRQLEEVLAFGLAQHAAFAKVAARRDRELDASRLDADQRFLLAQGTHSYYGSTQLLWQRNRPLWVVNEGEYRMMNTFDLTIDHLFFELSWHPWAVRDTLDLFSTRYSYRDRLQLKDGRTVAGGISFTHDMGVMNHFTVPGHSSYECDGLTSTFSHMTMEQLLNWVLAAGTYALRTDDQRWLRRQRRLLLDCAESLHRRDDPQPALRDGVLKHDSARCGSAGAEITTYDSLDVSLGQARNNLYLAVKALGAWVLLEQIFLHLREVAPAADARTTADRLAASLTEKFETNTGFFPAVFEDGNCARILPAVEGLVYPLYLGLTEAVDPAGRFGALLQQLRQHLTRALQPGVCLDGVSGAWKLSSTSTNTWFSKIAIAQHVTRRLFPEAMNATARAADRVHADWQRRPGCGANAMCDQIHSETGVACGSRYYPRGVTTILWLQE